MNFKTIVRPLVAALIAGGFAMNASANIANGTFTVSLTITKTCAVTTTAATNITLGSTVAGGTSAGSSGTFTVNCSKTTPFYIGLAPSNANTAGAGVLKGTGANTDTITYGLFSNAGATTVWGNTATTTTVGNGVTANGLGMAGGNAITETVYAKATGSTDVTPDTYTDTVTINVNF
jgi:spore coat protein U-like protein